MIQHPNLDPTTRRYMAVELSSDLAAGALPSSRRLTLAGEQVFPSLIDAAITDHDDDRLEREVASCGRLLSSRRRSTARLDRFRSVCLSQLRQRWPRGSSAATTSVG